MKWTLNDLKQALHILDFQCAPELESLEMGICMDSRQIQSNTFLVCLRGERFDAHQFAPEITQAQCPLLIVEKSWLDQGFALQTSYIAVEDSTKALGDLARYKAQQYQAKRISITGSNGKTTTKEMLNSVLSLALKGIATKANNNNHIGVPLTMFDLEPSHDYAIMEIGTNHSGEIAYGSGIALPQIALINNIGDSHLEFFQNRDNVFVEKISMRDSLQKDGLLILNGDDVYLSQVQSYTQHRLITYGLEKGDLKPSLLTWNAQACASFELEGHPIELQIPGTHNLYNALAVYLCAREMGLDGALIAQGLSAFRGSAGRTEILTWGEATLISDCYNANPSSMQMALQTLARMQCQGRRIAVLGDMFELGESGPQAHRDLGELLQTLSLDLVWTTGPLAQEIHQKYPQAQHFSNTDELLSTLSSSICPGDLVLFKASNGMKFQAMIRELLTLGGPHA